MSSSPAEGHSDDDDDDEDDDEDASRPALKGIQIYEVNIIVMINYSHVATARSSRAARRAAKGIW